MFLHWKYNVQRDKLIYKKIENLWNKPFFINNLQ